MKGSGINARPSNQTLTKNPQKICCFLCLPLTTNPQIDWQTLKNFDYPTNSLFFLLIIIHIWYMIIFRFYIFDIYKADIKKKTVSLPSSSYYFIIDFLYLSFFSKFKGSVICLLIRYSTIF